METITIRKTELERQFYLKDLTEEWKLLMQVVRRTFKKEAQWEFVGSTKAAETRENIMEKVLPEPLKS